MKQTAAFKNYSLAAIFFYSIVALIYTFSKDFHKHPERILKYDSTGYYAYLRYWFVDDDPYFNYYKNKPHQNFQVTLKDHQGNSVQLNKYSTGPALLISPFFLLGHVELYYSKNLPENTDSIYLFWYGIGAIFYAILSLLLLRSVLRQYYQDKVVALTLLILALGTNWFHYTIYDYIMSHTYSFFLFSFALFLSLQWYKTEKWSYVLGLSLTCGLIALTRLPNMVFFIVPAFIGVYNKESLLERFRFFLKHWNQIAVGILIFALPFIPQILYWQRITGFYWINSYGVNQENFCWLEPMFGEVLFGFRKGWFIYTPLALLGWIGLYHIQKHQKELFPIIILYLLINLYVISSWWCWWYGGSFGMRPLIETSVVLTFPIAALLEATVSSKVKYHGLNLIIVLLIGLNQFQSHQFQYLIIHWDSMTKAAYWNAFGVVPPVSEEFKATNKKLLIPPSFIEKNRGKNAQTIW